MAKGKRKVPGINASSTADISFILLIFFLVVTSMNSQEGLHVMLPKKSDNNEPPPVIKPNNILQVMINSKNKIMVTAGDMSPEVFKAKYGIEDVYDVSPDVIRKIAKDFIVNKDKLPEFPVLSNVSYTYTEYDEQTREEKAVHSLPSGKTYDIATNHVITLTTDRETSYSIYFQVANELYGAYNELRDEMAMAEYGKKFAELDQNQKGVVNEYYKYRVYSNYFWL